jgi:hypothetical protein
MDMGRIWWDSARPAPEVWPHVRALGAEPVCGRYLGTGGGAAQPLTRQEVRQCLSLGLAIVPIWNDARPPLFGFVPGVEAAERALTALGALGVPPGTVIVADVEASWEVDHAWLAGWCLAIARAHGQPGLYCVPHGQAMASLDYWAGALPECWIWVADWTEPPDAPPEAGVWAQQFASGAAGGRADLSVAWRWPRTIGPRAEGPAASPGAGSCAS